MRIENSLFFVHSAELARLMHLGMNVALLVSQLTGSRDAPTIWSYCVHLNETYGINITPFDAWKTYAESTYNNSTSAMLWP